MRFISLTLSAALFMTISTHAQVSSYATAMRAPGAAHRVNDSNFMKPEYVNNIQVSAMRDFVKRFNEPSNARWYKMKDGTYMVRFEQPGDAFRVGYNNHGDWVYSIQTYLEKKMPRDIRGIVKSVYYDYSITQVEEIEHTDAEATVYIVHLMDDTSWKTVRVCNGAMDVLETLYKR